MTTQSLPSFAHSFPPTSIATATPTLGPSETTSRPKPHASTVNVTTVRPSLMAKNVTKKRNRQDEITVANSASPSTSTTIVPRKSVIVNVKAENDEDEDHRDMLSKTPPLTSHPTGPSDTSPPTKKRRLANPGTPRLQIEDDRPTADTSTPISPVVMGVSFAEHDRTAIEKVRSMVAVKNQQKALIEQRRNSTASVLTGLSSARLNPDLPVSVDMARRASVHVVNGLPDRRQSVFMNTLPPRAERAHPVQDIREQQAHPTPSTTYQFPMRSGDAPFDERTNNAQHQSSAAAISQRRSSHMGADAHGDVRYSERGRRPSIINVPQRQQPHVDGDSHRRPLTPPPTHKHNAHAGPATSGPRLAHPIPMAPIGYSQQTQVSPTATRRPSLNGERAMFLAPFEHFFDLVNDASHLKTYLSNSLHKADQAVYTIEQQSRALESLIDTAVERKTRSLQYEIETLQQRLADVEKDLHDRRNGEDQLTTRRPSQDLGSTRGSFTSLRPPPGNEPWQGYSFPPRERPHASPNQQPLWGYEKDPASGHSRNNSPAVIDASRKLSVSAMRYEPRNEPMLPPISDAIGPKDRLPPAIQSKRSTLTVSNGAKRNSWLGKPSSPRRTSVSPELHPTEATSRRTPSPNPKVS